MILQTTYGTAKRWPEKSAGKLKPCGQIALIFLDFLLRFVTVRLLADQDKRTYKCDCIDRNQDKGATTNWIDENAEHDTPLSIYASPNPARHYVEFYYELSDIDTEGLISISDINGILIKSFIVSQNKGAVAWDTRNIPAGSYVFTLKTKYFEESGKLIIQ